MSPKLILTAAALSFAAFLSPAVYAASPAAVPADTQAAPQARPHNHMREKTGIPVRAPEAKPTTAKRPLHDHRTFHKG